MTLAIYHHVCIDGFAAAWAIRRAIPDAECVSAAYGQAPPDVRGRDVVIADFSYPRDVLLEMQARARSLRVLDHHVTARDALAGLECATFDMDRSGAGLAWDALHSTPRPWLVDYVEDRDLWRFALPDSEAVNAWIATAPFDFARWDRLLEDGLDDAVVRGRAVQVFVEQYVTEVAREARVVGFEGFDVPVVNVGRKLVSEVVGRLAETAPFAVGWAQHRSGRYVYSLRSRGPDGADVAAIAKRYGGGGHRQAAGFSLDRLLFS